MEIGEVDPLGVAGVGIDHQFTLRPVSIQLVPSKNSDRVVSAAVVRGPFSLRLPPSGTERTPENRSTTRRFFHVAWMLLIVVVPVTVNTSPVSGRVSVEADGTLDDSSVRQFTACTSGSDAELMPRPFTVLPRRSTPVIVTPVQPAPMLMPYACVGVPSGSTLAPPEQPPVIWIFRMSAIV